MPYITAKVEIDVDLGEFETADLLDELESREKLPTTSEELVEQIWMRRRNGQNYDAPLDQLIWQVLGKIV
jgi:hypothetical protein